MVVPLLVVRVHAVDAVGDSDAVHDFVAVHEPDVSNDLDNLCSPVAADHLVADDPGLAWALATL